MESVGSVRIPPDMCVELLVIDNNCTDETPAIIAQAAAASPFPVKRIIEPRQGLCFGRNRGLDEAAYEHVVYLDDDIDVARDWLDGYRHAIQEFAADCVVGPVTPRFEGQVPEYFTQRVLDSIGSPYSRRGSAMHLLAAEDAHEVPGCNFGVRREVARTIGGFNTSLDRVGKGLLAGGDFEFGMRLAATGRRVVYQPRCAIQHVIDAEKLSADYMRKRWSGAGTTRRVLQRKSSGVSWYRVLRYSAGIGRLLAASAFHRLLGNRSLAFERELEARQSWGYLTAPKLILS